MLPNGIEVNRRGIAFCGLRVFLNRTSKLRGNGFDNRRMLGSKKLSTQVPNAFVGCHTETVVGIP